MLVPHALIAARLRFAWCALSIAVGLAACNVYDPSLLKGAQSVPQDLSDAGPDANVIASPDGGDDAHVDDASTVVDATLDADVDAQEPLSCDPMRGDCNDDPSDGCETDLSREPNCGSCNRTCEKLPFLHTCRHVDDPATGVCMRPPCQCCNQLQGCQ